MSYTRKYLPTISELIDRLSIVQLKEVFIPEHKEEYAKEIKEIVEDLDELIYWEKPTGEMIRAIVVLAQMNLHIWHNETKYRAGEGDGNLGLTHGLNGIRKSVGWRVVAFSNSWMVLALGLTDIPLYNAVIMNVTGIVYFYLYERLWNKSQKGRYSE